MMQRELALALLGVWCACGAGAAESSVEQGLQQAMIWSPSASPGQQAYVAFRKSFALPGAPGSATLHIFADSRYLLWVNGNYVLRGPCRFNPKRPEYDSVDLRPFLHAGTNGLVVLVHHYAGAINGRIMQHAPGLTARLDVAGKEFLRTDASWRCHRNTEYLPSPNAWSSVPDVIDGRLKPGDWTASVFDDSGWEHATAADGGAWGALQPRGIPLARETELADMRLLPSGQALTSMLPLELPAGKEVVVDLRRMAMAYAEVELEAEEGSVLQIQYALRYVNGSPGETYGVGTTYTARRGRQRFMAADQWCSHYMTVKCASGRLTIHKLKMVDRAYPFERLGRFHCSDEMLNRLWDRAVKTIEAVSDDAYGSDARERDEWLQDPAEPNFITTRVALASPGPNGKPLYSDPRLLKNLLRHAALTQLPDGRILATFPTDRGPEDCHYVIEDYACQWVEALRLYYEATGDRLFLREMWPVLVKQMDWFLQRRTDRGLMLARQYTSFDDPLAYITGEGAALNAFIYQALRDAAALGRVLKEKTPAAGYDAAAGTLATCFNQQLWNEAEGTYNSGFVKDKLLGPTAHAALLALDRGIVPPDRRPSVRKWFLAHYKRPGSFHCCTNPDYEKMVADRAGINMPVTYYWVFQELYRMDSAARDLEAVQEMRRRWGPMVRESDDTGTLWEMFNGSESCHNYGAVPAYFLSSYVLGVRLDGPVWNRRLIIEPRLGDLANAEGVVVTEFGPLPVSWKQPGTELSFRFEVPKGIKAILRIPDADATTLSLDGRQARAKLQGRYATVAVGTGVHEGRIALKPRPALTPDLK
ncbi:MAG: GH116 family glycosyl hydrolase [Verrucomicrobiota bacterium]